MDLKNNIQPIGDFLNGELVTIPGITALCFGDYTLEVTGPRWTEEITLTLNINDPVAFINTFNENSILFVKVKLPTGCVDAVHGLNYLTDSNGHNCFKFCSLPEQCDTTATGGGSGFEDATSFMYNNPKYQTFGDVLDFDTDDPFSLGAWVNVGIIGSTMVILNKQGVGPNFVGWNWGIDSAGSPISRIGTSAADFMIVKSDTSILAGGWHLLGTTYNGNQAQNGWEFYLDGALTGRINVSGGAVNLGSTNAQPLFYGINAALLFPYCGNIDDPFIFTGVLDAADWVEAYNAGCPMDMNTHTKAANLVHYPRSEASSFDGNDWQVVDESPSNFDGVSVNMTINDRVASVPCP